MRPSSTPEEAAEGTPFSLTTHHLHVLFLKQAHLVSDRRMGTEADNILTTPSPRRTLTNRGKVQMKVNTWPVARNLQKAHKMS